ncbi:MAG: DUF5011 domain-containing protein [Myxococcaceae bacterium]|nr:DUF5011 domain-containing protein [Myxococcaceae bacterium]
MGLRINESWKVLIGTVGLSLVGCGGAGLEAEDGVGQSAQQLEGMVTLTLNGHATMNLECGVDTWSDPGATAKDGDGGPLPVITYNSGNDEYGPGPNPAAQGTYQVTYFAHDADWNQATAVRTVQVNDTIAPTLTLNGPATVTLQCYEWFEDPSATSSDLCYGDLSSQVLKTGEVQNWIAGSYTLTYTVQDSAGNAAPPVTRTVNVVNCPVW